MYDKRAWDPTQERLIMTIEATAAAPSNVSREEWETRVELAAPGMGDQLRVIDPQRVAMIQDQMRDSAHYHYDGRTEWAALVRTLERECPEYRS